MARRQRETSVPSVSTGRLPSPAQVRAAVRSAHAKFHAGVLGREADDYPASTVTECDLFGICVAGVDGAIYTAGDADYPFAIMSMAKPFVFALVCQAVGREPARTLLGVNSTGLPLNSVTAIELNEHHVTNPMVKPGALATTSLVPGTTAEEKWRRIHEGLSRFAGRMLALNDTVYTAASASNQRDQAIARLLDSYDRLYFDPMATTDLFTRQSSLNVTARDLAVMSATLADGGVNPLTKEQVISAALCQPVLAVMVTAGFSEMSGDWLYETGLPGMSGAGGLVTVAPGKGGMGAFAPSRKQGGGGDRPQLAAKFLAEQLGLSLLASRPHSHT